MMTTIRRQAASCLYGLAPLLRDILTGKLSRLELMEASDDDEDADGAGKHGADQAGSGRR
jgi:hypothetical protein